MDEIDRLKRCIGQFISINSLFSTTTKRTVAEFFCGHGASAGNLELVLFEVYADPHIVTTKHFADISPYSYFPQESEVLFMLGSIFRLTDISLNDNQVWIIRMELCGEDEHSLVRILKDMKQQSGTGEKSLHTFAKLLTEMGKSELAEKYYRRLHNETPSDDPSQKTVCNELGKVLSQKNEYNMSMHWREKASKVKEHRNLKLEARID
jgi:hypothetical protein